MANELFRPITECWICGGGSLYQVHRTCFELEAFAETDPQLLLYHNQNFELHRCADCGFLQPAVLPNLPNFFERLYAPYHDMQLHAGEDEAAGGEEAAMARDFHQGSKDLIFLKILNYLHGSLSQSSNRLLDVGSHVGRLLHLASRDGWTAEGLEVNPTTAEFARRTTGATVVNGAVDQLVRFPSERFGAITIVDVLEHIPEPLSVLRKIFEILSPGGIVAVKVPCGAGQLVKERLRSSLDRSYKFTIARNMYHVNHFGPRSLMIALERCGFEAIRFVASPPEIFRGLRFSATVRTLPTNAFRLLHYWLCCLPLLQRVPALNFHLIAFGRRPRR